MRQAFPEGHEGCVPGVLGSTDGGEEVGVNGLKMVGGGLAVEKVSMIRGGNVIEGLVGVEEEFKARSQWSCWRKGVTWSLGRV